MKQKKRTVLVLREGEPSRVAGEMALRERKRRGGGERGGEGYREHEGGRETERRGDQGRRTRGRLGGRLRGGESWRERGGVSVRESARGRRGAREREEVGA